MTLPALGEGFGKDHDFDVAGDVVEQEDRHPVPLLRLERAQAGDDAADPDVRFRRGEIGDAPGAERPEIVREALQRVAAHVEAERFLLAGKLLDLRPRRGLRQRRGARRRLVPVGPAKELRLPLVAIALVASAMLDGLVHRREQPGPA